MAVDSPRHYSGSQLLGARTLRTGLSITIFPSCGPHQMREVTFPGYCCRVCRAEEGPGIELKYHNIATILAGARGKVIS